jgi:hypothetical protein
LIRAQKRKAENDVSRTSTGFTGERETGKKRAAKLMYLIQNLMHAFYVSNPLTWNTSECLSIRPRSKSSHAVELNHKGLPVKMASACDLMSQETKYHS